MEGKEAKVLNHLGGRWKEEETAGKRVRHSRPRLALGRNIWRLESELSWSRQNRRDGTLYAEAPGLYRRMDVEQKCHTLQPNALTS